MSYFKEWYDNWVALNEQYGNPRTEHVEAMQDAFTAGRKLIIKLEWVCTNCSWYGRYSETNMNIYKGVLWRCCPTCKSICIPSTGVP